MKKQWYSEPQIVKVLKEVEGGISPAGAEEKLKILSGSS